jgi:hypothetical protein
MELGHAQADNEDEGGSEAGDTDVNHETATPSSINTVPTRKRKRPDIEPSLMDFMDPHKAIKSPLQEDGDLAFFISLLPSVISLNTDQKCTFRLQTMQLLRNLKNPKTLHASPQINAFPDTDS